MTYEELKKRIRTELDGDPELAGYAKNRLRDRNDPYRPLYHFSSPGGYLNDPCGFCFFKGLYHLFYQFVPENTGLLGWGHAVSVDKLRWIDLPPAVMPTVEDCCGSGGAIVDGDRVILCYQGDMKGKPGGAIHIVESTDDLLLRFRRVTEGPVITTIRDDGRKNPYNAFDPCMWKEGDLYYLLSAGGGSLPHPDGLEKPDQRKVYLFRSRDLRQWEYLHPFLAEDRFSRLGDDGACPYFLPVGQGKHMLIHFSHMSGAHYIIGRYDRDEMLFHAEKAGDFNAHSWLSGVHAPSAFSEPDGISCIFNLNYGFLNGSCNQIMSLPRKLTLREDGLLGQEPDVDLKPLRGESWQCGKLFLPANRETVAEGIHGRSLEMELTADISEKTPMAGIFLPPNLWPVFIVRVLRSPDALEYTEIRFYRNRSKMNWEVFRTGSFSWAGSSQSVLEVDSAHSSRRGDVAIHPTEHQELMLLPTESLSLHLFVDRSVVEVFANGQPCISVRVYPSGEDCDTVSFLSIGVDAEVSYRCYGIGSASEL